MEITPAMLRATNERAEALITIVTQLVSRVMGDNYKVVLILAKDGDPNSIAIISDFDENEPCHAIIQSAAERMLGGDMIDGYAIPKEH